MHSTTSRVEEEGETIQRLKPIEVDINKQNLQSSQKEVRYSVKRVNLWKFPEQGISKTSQKATRSWILSMRAGKTPWLCKRETKSSSPKHRGPQRGEKKEPAKS